MSRPVWGVDAFTGERFRGNPAAVCFLEAAVSEAWMQRVAAELNLSETAFLTPRPGGWGLRWFTPTVEVALCGHATLASAHALWESGRLTPAAAANFFTERSGLLTCRRQGDWIEMDFPALPVASAPAPEGLAAALGATTVWTGRTRFDLFCELADEATVRRLAPDHPALARLPVRGVIVTARGSDGFDMVSRFFAPGSCVTEDPVTGSAHCSLAPYWSERLGRPELRAWQASPRGGEVRTRLVGDRVLLRGQAVTVWHGELG